MPGYAKITLSYEPTGSNIPPEGLEALDAAFGDIFTRKTERELSVFVSDSSPSFLELREKLDRVVEATAVGSHGAGRVTADPSQVVNEADWLWTRWMHNTSRRLLLDGAQFSFNASNWSARVVAEYGWFEGRMLP